MNPSSQQALNNLYKKNLIPKLKKLNIETRNKVRAIYTSDDADSIKVFNKLRLSLSINKLLDVEDAVSALHDKFDILPDKFPSSFQTKNEYTRLVELPFDKQLELIDCLARKHSKTLDGYISAIAQLNQRIVSKEFSEANKEIKIILDKYGFSHCLLRKIIFLGEMPENNQPDNYLSDLINENLSNSKVVVASLIHCYQDEQDYLGIKRSIMGLPNRGDSNKFTRDISRTPFHPHAKDQKNLNEIIQSNLQSSLLDALIIIKVNIRLIGTKKYKNINKVLADLESAAPTLDEIVNLHGDDEDSEYIFIKQSSAWLESEDVVNLKFLIDHFYDSPDSEYSSLTPEVLGSIENYITCKCGSCLVSDNKLLNIQSKNLHSVQLKGTITRTAVFNFLTYTRESALNITEEQLFLLMNRTSSLDRTIDIKSMKSLLPMLPTQEAKLIIRLLIAKKSRNEVDQIALKSLTEKILKSRYDGNLISFIDDLSKRSDALAIYLYETCNEDFIARMTRVIKTTKKITETRAALHTWRGEYSGEKLYLDRARNLKINSQINEIRGEIDDNRIYVEITRFSEWFGDNISSQLGSILIVMDSNDDLSQFDDPQLIDLIENCFYEFCTNSFFGIASYLGRRIRHGTFRGHLYSSVINNVEKKYFDLINTPQLEAKWTEWKSEYEKQVLSIIDNKLYIHSPQKKLGLLYPNLRDPAKRPVVKKCISTIIEHFKISGNVFGIEPIIIESCWRIAEVDLNRFNSYIKNQKPNLTNVQILNNTNLLNLNNNGQRQLKELEREIFSLISEKLNVICTWFKKPQSASPKASLSLLYKAVVSEVQQTFDNFNPDTDFDEKDDIDLYGGVYHLFYDALYVIIFNAAKHGKYQGNLIRSFEIIEVDKKRLLYFKIKSEIKESSNECGVLKQLTVLPNDNLENAQVTENRSGIRKLYNLEILDKKFKVETIGCENRHVITEFSYELGY